MTSDKEQFITLETKEGGSVIFGDNNKGYIIGVDKIQIIRTFIKNVLYVKGLKHNLFSISKLCDKGYKVSFETLLCIITNPTNDSIIFIGRR